MSKHSNSQVTDLLAELHGVLAACQKPMSDRAVDRIISRENRLVGEIVTLRGDERDAVEKLRAALERLSMAYGFSVRSTCPHVRDTCRLIASAIDDLDGAAGRTRKAAA